MDVRRKTTTSTTNFIEASPQQPPPQASDALPLPLFLTNGIFFTLFFSVAYFLLTRRRENIRISTPLHVVTFSEMAAMLSLIASFIYLLGFFGLDFLQSFIPRPSNEEEQPHPYIEIPKPKPVLPTQLPADDEKIVKSVVVGTAPSYSLESKLGDCAPAAKIQREGLQRVTGKSIEGLPLHGFDYESILGQCCEMPVGYVQIPVGIVGPLLLDGVDYFVPMATTEGCLVASTNRGCKAIYASGGTNSVFLIDGDD